MDPLTTIGLVANIIAFVDFGYKTVAAVREIGHSVSGATWGNESLKLMSKQMRGLALGLTSGKLATAMSADELRLQGLVKECRDVSTELMALLEGLKVKSSHSKRHAMNTVFRNIRKKDEKNILEK